MSKTLITASEEYAIRAKWMKVGGDLYCDNSIIKGKIILDATEVHGNLYFKNVSISLEEEGISFSSNNINVRGDFYLSGLNSNERIEIRGSEVNGIFDMRNVKCPGKKLDLSDCRLRRIIIGEKVGIIDLTRVESKSLEDYYINIWKGGKDNDYIIIDGFIYENLINPSGELEGKAWHEAVKIAENRKVWLDAQNLAHRTNEFRSQPWTQLISVLRRDGFIDAANELDIERRRRMRKFVTASRLVRAVDWFLDVVAGYGYKPWRTVGVSLAVILAFMVLWTVAMLGCAHEGCRDESVFMRTDVAGYSRVTGGDTTRVSAGRGFHPLPERFSGRGLQTPSTTFGTGLKTPSRNSGEATGAPTYPDFNPVGFSFDVFIPLFNFGYQDTWSVNTSWNPFYQRNILGYKFTLSWGGILYILYLLEIFLGAVLTTIAIAGFTGLLRGRRNE